MSYIQGGGGGGVASQIISPASPCSIGVELSVLSLSKAAGAYPAANRAFYIPFYVPDASITAVKMYCANGATASGNVDVGIYNLAGTKLVSSGSTAQAGISDLQLFDIADTALTTGWYYLALACDNTTATFGRWSASVGFLRPFGVLYQATAFPLPSTMTGAAMVAPVTAYLPDVGLSRLATF